MAEDKPCPKLNDDGVEEYSWASVIDNNLAILLWITLGTVCCWFFNPLSRGCTWASPRYGLRHHAKARLHQLLLLREALCVRVGQTLRAHVQQGNIEHFNDSIGLKIAPAVYGLLTLIPLVLGTISAVQHFSWIKPVFLAALLITGFYSGTVARKKSCARCRMYGYCKGSAAKPPTPLP